MRSFEELFGTKKELDAAQVLNPFANAERQDLLPPIPESWDSDLRKQFAEVMKMTSMRKALEILLSTASEMGLSLASGADLTTDPGIKLALAKQNKMRGLQIAHDLLLDLATPETEEESTQDV